MIPVRLELTNFLAYRDPTPLDFNGIHLACLAGANGAGKSSLLDAMTWALWGRARASRDDDLIHVGQTETRVVFDFALDNNLYRIVRKREKSGRGKSTLDFQVRDGEAWRDLGESSIRQTQAKIDRLLRMNYDTFINSAFLLQGRADEFTVKTPARRKDVLSDILGLEIWSQYEERAKAKISALKDKLVSLDMQVAEIEGELEHEAEYNEALTQAQQHALDAADARQAGEAQMRVYDSARQKLETDRARLADLERRIAQGEAELQEAVNEIARSQTRLDSYHRVLAEQEAIETGYASWQDARRQERDLGTRLMAYTDLQSRLSALEQRIQAARGELAAQIRLVSAQVEEAQKTVEIGQQAQIALETVQREIDALVYDESELEALRQEITDLKEERASLESENRKLKTEFEETRQKLAVGRARSRELEKRIGQTESELKRAEGETARHRTRLDDFRAFLTGQQKEIEAGYIALQQARERDQAFSRRLSAYSELRERRNAIEQRVQVERSNLEATLRVLVDRIAETEHKVETGRQAGAELTAVQDALRVLDEHGRELRSLLDKVVVHKEERAALESANLQLEAETGELQERISHLQQSHEPNCPLCGQDLSDVHRVDLLARLQRDNSEIAVRQQTNRERLDAIGAELVALQHNTEALETEMRQLPGLQARQSTLNDLIVAGQEAEVQLQALITEKSTLETRLKMNDFALDAQKEYAEIQAKLESLGYDLNEHEQARHEIERLMAFDAHKSELDTVLAKVPDTEHALAEAGASVQAWRSTLQEDEKSKSDHLEQMDRLESEANAKEAQRQTNKARLEAIDKQLAEKQSRAQAHEAELRRLPALHARKATLTDQMTARDEALVRLQSLAIEAKNLQTRLDSADYALDEQTERATVRNGIESLGYDPATHEAIRSEVERLASFEARKAELDAAQTGIPEVTDTLEKTRQRLRTWQAAVEDDKGSAEKIRTEIAAHEATLTGAEAHVRRLQALHLAEAEARTALGAAQQRVDVLKTQRTRLADLNAQRDKARAEQAIYDELRAAFGKNGVPAMIIDAAIPEIEDAANELLHRLTAGQIHLRLETQREKVTGGVAETLDIIINDELGDRAYEMYSGGEQFRVNFAVRIALSRLLARRAGAQLRTLVIDEGFGTQDTAGRQRLVEAINAIQDDFDKILVITHVEELKDVFPARIEVTKTERGSVISLA